VTAITVVDASAICAFLFGEPERERIAAAMAAARLVAPRVLPFEVANVCLTKIRQNPDSREKFLRAHSALDRAGIELVGVNWPEALRIGEQARLSAYDASYLWLSRALDANLLTLDVRLGRASVALS
jgi:predicted nucleic acid-binding protein